MTDIQRHVYKPLHWQISLGYSVDDGRCREYVHDTFGVGFHQCTRKPRVSIQGYGYCRQHANMMIAEGFVEDDA